MLLPTCICIESICNRESPLDDTCLFIPARSIYYTMPGTACHKVLPELLCHCRGKEPQTVCKQKTVAVCSNKTLFTKMGGGPHRVHEP